MSQNWMSVAGRRDPDKIESDQNRKGLLFWTTGLPMMLVGLMLVWMQYIGITDSHLVVLLFFTFGLAACSAGIVLAIIFTVPSIVHQVEANQEAQRNGGIGYVPNASFGRITEWVTSAITGVTLVSLYPGVSAFWRVTGELAPVGDEPALRAALCTTTAALAICSFVGAYIKARIVLPALISKSDAALVEALRKLQSEEEANRKAIQEMKEDVSSSRAEIEKIIEEKTSTQISLLNGYFWMSMHGKTQGAISRAIYHFDQLLDRDAANADALREKARALKTRNEPGDLPAAVALLTRAIESGHRSPTIFYNRACYRALAGEAPAGVLEDLRKAIDGNKRFKAFARVDADLAPVREDPGFRALVKDDEKSPESE